MYEIRLYKDSYRVPYKTLSYEDARIFYKELKIFINWFSKKYKTKISNSFLNINIDKKKINRSRRILSENGIETIEDILIYLNVEPKYIFADGEKTDDLSIKLSEIVVLDIYTDWKYLTNLER